MIRTYSELEDYEKRVVDEFSELDTKYRKLKLFTCSAKFAELDNASHFLLMLQEGAMLTYLDILRERIRLMGYMST